MLPANQIYVANVEIQQEEKLLTLSLAKPKQFLKLMSCLFVGEIHYVTKSFCKCANNKDKLAAVVN